MLNGAWQNEEYPYGYPFDDSSGHTIIKIVANTHKEGYDIYINGKFFYTFRYRTNGTPDRVHKLVFIQDMNGCTDDHHAIIKQIMIM